MDRVTLFRHLAAAREAVAGFVLDERDRKSPQARLGSWRIAFEHRSEFSTVALQWLGHGESPDDLTAGWRLCPPSERRNRGWQYRTTLPNGEVLKFLQSLHGRDREGDGTIEDDEVGLSTEGRTQLRLHKLIERRPHLAMLAKRHHGYTCQACSFDFAKMYGDIGHEYIEAHHLHPLALRRGDTTDTNPKKDFAVLCSNCHRMIHRSPHFADVAQFKRNYVRVSDA